MCKESYRKASGRVHFEYSITSDVSYKTRQSPTYGTKPLIPPATVKSKWPESKVARKT